MKRGRCNLMVGSATLSFYIYKVMLAKRRLVSFRFLEKDEEEDAYD